MKILKSALFTLGLLLFASIFCASAVAIPIDGEIGFVGLFSSIDSNGNQTSLNFATGLDFPLTLVAGANGDLSPADGLNADFSTFQFSPVMDPSPVMPLWSVSTSVGDFSFDLESVNVTYQSSTQLNLRGTGTLHGPNFDDTLGTWNFTGNTEGSIFTFSSGSISVPDASIMFLLGPALMGLGIIGRRKTLK